MELSLIPLYVDQLLCARLCARGTFRRTFLHSDALRTGGGRLWSGRGERASAAVFYGL